MHDRELRKVQQESLFDNLLAQEYLKNGKASELNAYLESAENRLKSGMNPDEIEATEARAKKSYLAQQQ